MEQTAVQNLKAVASMLFPELTKGYFKFEMARHFTQRPQWTQIPLMLFEKQTRRRKSNTDE